MRKGLEEDIHGPFEGNMQPSEREVRKTKKILVVANNILTRCCKVNATLVPSVSVLVFWLASFTCYLLFTI
jgi:hypothetical protein